MIFQGLSQSPVFCDSVVEHWHRMPRGCGVSSLESCKPSWTWSWAPAQAGLGPGGATGVPASATPWFGDSVTLLSPGGWWEVCDGFGDHELWMSAHSHGGDQGVQDGCVGTARMWGSTTSAMSQCTHICASCGSGTPHICDSPMGSTKSSLTPCGSRE